jgi:aspartate/methionine/tyrosine aminotransferase
MHAGHRFDAIPGFDVDRVAAATENDPEVLRLEALETDLRPPAAAIEATRASLDRDEDNSYLPLSGRMGLREVVSRHLQIRSGQKYDPDTEILITAGGNEGLLDAVFATTDVGDEVIVTDPTYAGMIQRVRMVGCLPRFVPYNVENNEWRLDIDALRLAISERTRAIFFMNPSMPSGAVLTRAEWDELAAVCRNHNLWLIYNAAMEAILFDDRPLIHPAGLEGMRERTLIVGSASKEYCMVGWRVGWVAGPKEAIAQVARAHMYNVVTPPGLMQSGVAVALQVQEQGLKARVKVWEKRRDEVLRQLDGMGVVKPGGGWSMLLNVSRWSIDAMEASRRLLQRGKVAVTPMNAWGDRNSSQYLRIVFSKEPTDRLRELRDRFRRALG